MQSPSSTAYQERRRRVGARLREDRAALVLFGGKLRRRSGDTEYRFRPDSDFHYLTGLSEPGAVLVMRPDFESDAIITTAFVRPRDEEAEVWAGRRLGPGGFEAHGIDKGHPISELGSRLPALLDGVHSVYLPLGRWPELDRRVIAASTQLHRRNRYGETPPVAFADARMLMGEERIFKDPAALASLRRAIDLTAHAHMEAIKAARPGMHEYELEALIEYEFRRAGSTGPGYGSIVGSGDNATILHYVENDSEMRAGELVLIDAGCEWDYFSGDITRTFPVDGNFTAEQRDLYQVVLDANLAGIEASVVGSNIDLIHERALEILCQGLLDLQFVTGETVQTMMEQELYKPWYMHRTSHWLGVDVHDAGHYTLDRKPRPLEPGFVFTVEPGLYVQARDERVPAGFRGVGVRIEDDVLVTEAEPEVLSLAVPKDPDALESLAAT